MTLILPLEPQDEANLMASAQGRHISADQLVREAVGEFLDEVPALWFARRQPTRSWRGLLSRYGTAPPAEAIGEDRKEMIANFRCFCVYRRSGR